MRPNFLIIGAQKCGTSSLYALFKQHPQIGMARLKETHFFCTDENWQRGWEWYESLFAHCAGKKAVGEATPLYSRIGTHPRSVERIAGHLPDVRILYIVRHPLERMESAWLMYVHMYRIRETFCEFVQQSPGAVDASLYWKQISAYRTCFPDERILVLFLEDLKRDARGVLRRCFQFLEVDPDVQVSDPERPRNARAAKATESEALVRFRRTAAYRLAKALTPAGLYESVKRKLYPRLHHRLPDPVWTEVTRRWAIEQVIEDSLQFLRFYGKPIDFWDFRPIPPATRIPAEYAAAAALESSGLVQPPSGR